MEVKQAFGGQISTQTCSQWVSSVGITHTLLRDDGQVDQNLSMLIYDVIVMDRALKIVYRGGPAYDPSVRAAAVAALAAQK